MIEIKAWFSDWKEVDAEKARDFITGMIKGMNCGKEKSYAIVNEKHLRGITVQELLEV